MGERRGFSKGPNTASLQILSQTTWCLKMTGDLFSLCIRSMERNPFDIQASMHRGLISILKFPEFSGGCCPGKIDHAVSRIGFSVRGGVLLRELLEWRAVKPINAGSALSSS